jgi:type I restriction enzyme S subunit
VKQLPFPPPLPEQERIVAKLDAAFAAIDTAKANVERNLHNAKELFQSKLNEVFNEEKEGWVEKKLSECIRLKSGDGLTAKDMVAGGYPVYGGNGIAGHHDAFNLEGSNVIIGRVGALCGNARYVNEPIWLTDNAFKVSDFLAEFNHEFLTLLLNYCDLRSYARQAAQPVVSNSSMKDVPLAFPKSLEEQTILVGKFESLREVLTSATTNYTHKLTELETLKKSLLERAFRGEI